jgi:hypothetical protein
VATESADLSQKVESSDENEHGSEQHQTEDTEPRVPADEDEGVKESE